MNVRDLMSPEARICHPHESLEQAARELWDGDVGSLPVVDGGRVIAMLTDRDVCMAAYTRGRGLADLRVHHCMSRGLVTADADEPVESALARMAEFRVRRVPVVDRAGGLLGVFSIADVARASANGQGSPELAAVLSRALARIQKPSEKTAPDELIPQAPPAKKTASSGVGAGTRKPAARTAAKKPKPR